jgi:hypothetical protein
LCIASHRFVVQGVGWPHWIAICWTRTAWIRVLMPSRALSSRSPSCSPSLSPAHSHSLSPSYSHSPLRAPLSQGKRELHELGLRIDAEWNRSRILDWSFASGMLPDCHTAISGAIERLPDMCVTTALPLLFPCFKQEIACMRAIVLSPWSRLHVCIPVTTLSLLQKEDCIDAQQKVPSSLLVGAVAPLRRVV